MNLKLDVLVDRTEKIILSTFEEGRPRRGAGSVHTGRARHSARGFGLAGGPSESADSPAEVRSGRMLRAVPADSDGRNSDKYSDQPRPPRNYRNSRLAKFRTSNRNHPISSELATLSTHRFREAYRSMSAL